MKTREERGIEFANSKPAFVEKDIVIEVAAGYATGAKAEYAELTRRNDPKEVLPEVDKMVLVKRKSDAPLPYDLAQYDGSCWIDSWCGLIIEIIGWREIHE